MLWVSFVVLVYFVFCFLFLIKEQLVLNKPEENLTLLVQVIPTDFEENFCSESLKVLKKSYSIGLSRKAQENTGQWKGKSSTNFPHKTNLNLMQFA